MGVEGVLERGGRINIFEELDQITPCVTDQLQVQTFGDIQLEIKLVCFKAFCSLAVNQMKQYPAMMQTLQDSINVLSDSITKIHSRIDKLEVDSATS